jgi:hypothetical protein
MAQAVDIATEKMKPNTFGITGGFIEGLLRSSSRWASKHYASPFIDDATWIARRFGCKGPQMHHIDGRIFPATAVDARST